jgi:hypothetical protein
VCRARRVVHEEGSVRCQRLLLTDPQDRPVGHVLGEVVALLRGPVRLYRCRPLVEGRVVLVRLSGNEPVEVLEPAATGRAGIERANGAGLPHRHLVTLAELSRGVAVEPQRLRQRRTCVRPDRVVSRSRRRHLGDPTHAHRVMVAASQQRLPRRGAQRGGVEPVELRAAGRQPLSSRRAARPTEGARGREPDIVEQDDQHIRCALRWPQRLDRRERSGRVLGVLKDRPRVGPIGDRKLVPTRFLSHHCLLLSGSSPGSCPSLSTPWAGGHPPRRVRQDGGPPG